VVPAFRGSKTESEEQPFGLPVEKGEKEKEKKKGTWPPNSSHVKGQPTRFGRPARPKVTLARSAASGNEDSTPPRAHFKKPGTSVRLAAVANAAA